MDRLISALPLLGAAVLHAPADVPEIRPGVAAGYLSQKQLPDSLGLLPPPPDPGSAAFQRDEEAARAAARLKDTPRWKRAAVDADLAFPAVSQVFACALQVPVDERRTPALYRLLRRTMTDVGLSTYGAKTKYQRVRPFAMHDGPTCRPGDEAFLRKDGSYPSGHSAVGWGWALILTEVDPDRTDAILARGRDFGQSRIVCNVHWQSDVDAGRVIASGTVARLHADAGFRADLEAAKAEVRSLREQGRTPPGDCAAEAASLSTSG